MKTLNFFLLFFAFSFPAINVVAQCDSILYHDAAMESQWGSSTYDDHFSLMVRFTPAYYPAQLCAVRAYFRNADANSTFKWRAWSDPSGAALGGVSPIYLSPVAFANPAAGGIANQTYEAYSDLTSANITINSGDMYVGVTQTLGFFGMGIDNYPNSSVAVDRQWQLQLGSWATLANQASNGQFGITAFFEPSTVGIEETNTNESNIAVYPNPATDNITIECPMSSQIEISNIEGQLLKTLMSSNSKTNIDVSTLPCGVYVVKVKTEKGVTVRKFIKE